MRDNADQWGRCRVEPWWPDTYKKLVYRNEPFNDAVTEARWRDLGFSQSIFTGDLYDMRQDQPEWIDQFSTIFNLKNMCWSIYKMRPGRCLPNHSDTYATYMRLYNVAHINHVKRYVIFLEDWQSGHYFEIDQTPVMPWRAGDGIYWFGQAEHIAANLGHTDRYTLQLTGLSP